MIFDTGTTGDPGSSLGNVIEAVADQTDTDPRELPPLYDTIDPDALDSVVECMDEGEVSFRYAGVYVTVNSDQTVIVSEESPAECDLTQATPDD